MGGHKEKARLLIERHKFELARTEVLEALKENQEDQDVFSLLGLCEFHLNQFADSVAHLQKAVSLDPQAAHPYYLLAWVLAHQEDGGGKRKELNDRATRSLDKALELNPLDPDYWALRAEMQLNLDQPKKALVSLEKGLRNFPQHIICLNLRSLALARLGDATAADATAVQSIALNPENAWSYTSRGWAATAKGDYRGAASHFEEALKLDPTIELALNGMALARTCLDPRGGKLFRAAHWVQRKKEWLMAGAILTAVGAFPLFKKEHWVVILPLAFLGLLGLANLLINGIYSDRKEQPLEGPKKRWTAGKMRPALLLLSVIMILFPLRSGLFSEPSPGTAGENYLWISYLGIVLFILSLTFGPRTGPPMAKKDLFFLAFISAGFFGVALGNFCVYVGHADLEIYFFVGGFFLLVVGVVISSLPTGKKKATLGSIDKK